MKQFFLLISFVLLPYLLIAQYYVLGEDPSGIKWRQINTDNFQIIYPAGVETEAQRMASIIEKVYHFAGVSLQHQPSKISVILHTSTVRSNGFVAWAPSRVELFTTPHQEIYAQDWLEQLAIHEFRHVVQIDKIDSELPGIFRIILGEQVAAMVIGVYLPFWFLEGDAVATETALSKSGRGRVPSFEMELKAQSVEKGVYSYDKAYLGSYKDYIPDYYQMGYQMVAGVRNKYGPDSWSKVLDIVAHKPLSVNAFARGLKAVTGKNHIKLYDEIFNDLKNSWTLKDKTLEKTDFTTITKSQKGYVSYRYPYPINDSTYFSVKYSINDVTRFVLIGPKGKEKIIFTPGELFEESITYGQGDVFWIESQPDIRWSHREYSLLRIMNLNSGIVTEKKFEDKIFAPCLSADGQYLAAVKVNSDNRCSIVVLSPQTGEIKKECALPTDLFILTPSWGENNKELFAIVLGSKGKSLAKINPFNGSTTILLPYSYNELKRPLQRGNMVYYTGTMGGTDDLYGYNLNEKLNYKITSSRFGVRDVQTTADGHTFVYCDYTSDGFKVVKMPLVPDKFIISDSLQTHQYQLANKLTSQENGIPDFSTLDTTTYQSKHYSKIGHIFNFHSWAPFNIDFDTEEIKPGVSFLSQNKLSTAITQLGYEYSSVNKTGKWVAKFDYTGLFPVLKLNADYGTESSHYYQINTYTSNHIVRKDTQRVDFNYNLLNIRGLVNLPLNLSHGRTNRLIQPELQIGYRQFYEAVSTPFSNTNDISLTYRLYAHNLRKLGVKDIQPAIGQVMDLSYHYSPFGDASIHKIWSAEGILYLPGLMKHHGIKIYSGYQEKESGNYTTDYISYPRGYTNVVNSQMFCLKSDYVLPLLYPDWSLGRLSYFRRISLRLFYDNAWALVPITNQNTGYRIAFGSEGGELTADCNFMRLYVPAKIGVRSSYLNDQKKLILEFLLSINFSSL